MLNYQDIIPSQETFKPLGEEVSGILAELDVFRREDNPDSLKIHQLRRKLFVNLGWSSLQEINALKVKPQEFCKLWEDYIESGSEGDNYLGMIQSLLHLTELSPIIYRRLNDRYGLQILTDKIRIETHSPPRVDGMQAMASFFACDDKLPHLIKFRGDPHSAVNKEAFQLDLTKFTPILSDEAYPRGRMGMVSLTDSFNIVFSGMALGSTNPDSRGIIMPDQLYTAGKNNPLHLAWIPGLDTNMSHIISLFRHYHITGEDLTAKNVLA